MIVDFKKLGIIRDTIERAITEYLESVAIIDGGTLDIPPQTTARQEVEKLGNKEVLELWKKHKRTLREFIKG